MEIPTLSGNELKLIKVLMDGQSRTGAELMRKTGIVKGSVYPALYKMLDTKKVIKSDSSGRYSLNQRGRRAYLQATRSGTI